MEEKAHFDLVYRKADKAMMILILVHAFFATFISSISYDTYWLGGIASLFLVTLTLLAYRFFRGKPLFRLLVAAILMIFSSVYIQQHLGRIEFHFHVFVGIAFLMIYKDYLPTVVAGVTTSLHHILFNYLQADNITIFGHPIYVFNYGCGWDIVWLHIFFVWIEVMVLSLFIKQKKGRYLEVIQARNNYYKLIENLESEVSKRTEDLTRVNELYRETQAITHLGNWEWDIKNNVLTWNDEIYYIFGLKPQSMEANYETFLSFVHIDDRQKVQKSVEDALNNDVPYSVVHRLSLLDNTIKYVREQGKVYKNAKGEAIRMVGTVQDITTEIKAKKDLEQSERKFRMMSEYTTTAICIYNEKFLYVNPAMERITGYTKEELTQMSPLMLIPENGLQRAKNNIQRRLKGEYFSEDYPALTIYTKDGKERVVSIHVSTIDYENGYAAVGTLVDITESRETQKEIRKLSQVIEQTDDIVKITNEYGVLTYVNDAFVAHTGYTRQEVLGKKPNFLKSGQHDPEFYNQMWDTILKGSVFRAILSNRKRDKSIYYEEQTITPILDEKGKINSFVSTGKDITERILLEEKLTEMATTDKLTHIYNRHKFDQLLNEECERYRRYQSPLSLIMLDIDHFKKINDTYGHDVGDSVLVEFTSVIQSCIRKVDKFARWGGEEFMLLCPQSHAGDVSNLAEKIRMIIDNHEFETVGSVTVSAGTTEVKEGDTISTVLKRLDKALYQAKSDGRNRVVHLK